MSTATPTGIERAVAAAVFAARKGQSSELAACHAATLTKLLGAARRHLATKPQARAIDYRGMRFRLHQFDGWLIVLTWREQPVIGPVRIRQEGAA